jgi:CBS domain-containing membrane protein
MLHLFRPILAGATLRDRLLACGGGLLGIAFTAAAAFLILGTGPGVPSLVAPMGASAVLVFAVPASPLAQPWPVIGGNMISALVGVTVARLVPEPALAAGLAVGGAILAMSLLRCLHPPGGAAALTAVIGGPAMKAAGFLFPFVPVALDAVLLTLAGLLFHRLSGHSYPHRVAVPTRPISWTAPDDRDLDRALAEMGDSLDIARDDLKALLRRIAAQAELRGDGRRR